MLLLPAFMYVRGSWNRGVLWQAIGKCCEITSVYMSQCLTFLSHSKMANTYKVRAFSPENHLKEWSDRSRWGHRRSSKGRDRKDVLGLSSQPGVLASSNAPGGRMLGHMFRKCYPRFNSEFPLMILNQYYMNIY